MTFLTYIMRFAFPISFLRTNYTMPTMARAIVPDWLPSSSAFLKVSAILFFVARLAVTSVLHRSFQMYFIELVVLFYQWQRYREGVCNMVFWLIAETLIIRNDSMTSEQQAWRLQSRNRKTIEFKIIEILCVVWIFFWAYENNLTRWPQKNIVL